MAELLDTPFWYLTTNHHKISVCLHNYSTLPINTNVTSSSKRLKAEICSQLDVELLSALDIAFLMQNGEELYSSRQRKVATVIASAKFTTPRIVDVYEFFPELELGDDQPGDLVDSSYNGHNVSFFVVGVFDDSMHVVMTDTGEADIAEYQSYFLKF